MTYAFLGAAQSDSAQTVQVERIDPARWHWAGPGRYVWGDSQIPFGEDFSAYAFDSAGNSDAALKEMKNQAAGETLAPLRDQLGRLEQAVRQYAETPIVQNAGLVMSSIDRLSEAGGNPEVVLSVARDFDQALLSGQGEQFARSTLERSPIGKLVADNVDQAMNLGSTATAMAMEIVALGDKIARGELSLADFTSLISTVLGTIQGAMAVLGSATAAMMAGPQAVVGMVMSVFTALVGMFQEIFAPPSYTQAAIRGAQVMVGSFAEDERRRMLMRAEARYWRTFSHVFDMLARLKREVMVMQDVPMAKGPRPASLTLPGSYRGQVIEAAFATTFDVHEEGFLIACRDDHCVLPIGLRTNNDGTVVSVDLASINLSDYHVWRPGPCDSPLYAWVLDPPATMTATTASYTTGAADPNTPDGLDVNDETGHWSAQRQLRSLRRMLGIRAKRRELSRLKDAETTYLQEFAFFSEGDVRRGPRTLDSCSPWLLGEQYPEDPSKWPEVKRVSQLEGQVVLQCEGEIGRGSGIQRWSKWPVRFSREDAYQDVYAGCAFYRQDRLPTRSRPNLVPFECRERVFKNLWSGSENAAGKWVGPEVMSDNGKWRPLRLSPDRIDDLWRGDATFCLPLVNGDLSYEGGDVYTRQEIFDEIERRTWDEIWDLELIRTWFLFDDGFLAQEVDRDPVIAATWALMDEQQLVPVSAWRDADGSSRSAWEERFDRGSTSFTDLLTEIETETAQVVARGVKLLMALTAQVNAELQMQIAAKIQAERKRLIKQGKFVAAQTAEHRERIGRSYGAYFASSALNDYARVPCLGPFPVPGVQPPPGSPKCGPATTAESLLRVSEWVADSSIKGKFGRGRGAEQMLSVLHTQWAEQLPNLGLELWRGDAQEAQRALHRIATEPGFAEPFARGAAILLSLWGKPGPSAPSPRRFSPSRSPMHPAVRVLHEKPEAWRRAFTAVDDTLDRQNITKKERKSLLDSLEWYMLRDSVPGKQRAVAASLLEKHGRGVLLWEDFGAQVGIAMERDRIANLVAVAEVTLQDFAEENHKELLGQFVAVLKQEDEDDGEEGRVGVVPFLIGAAAVAGIAYLAWAQWSKK